MSCSQASWPATLVCQPQILGYLQDTNQIQKSRDQGRSFSLAGRKYYLFGDTFCFDNTGKAVCVSNTIALVDDQSQPLESTYQRIDTNGVMSPFLQLTDSEIQHQNNTPGNRITLWGFSGVVEVADGLGLLWYEKGIEHKPPGQPQSWESLGIGVAQITIDQCSGQPVATRNDNILFSPSEPNFGSLTTLLKDDHVYLYGKLPGGCQTGLARVPILFAADKQSYERWDGQEWTADQTKTPASLFEDLPQGEIFKSDLFGIERPYVFVGVSKWADSQIRVGTAPTPEGPWDIRPVGQAQGYKNRNGWMYCVYPHPWAMPDSHPSLFVTWSEQWPGGVVAAKLNFQPQSSTG